MPRPTSSPRGVAAALIFAAALLLLVLVAACGSSERAPAARTPAPVASTATAPPPAPTPPPVRSLRDVDFESPALVADLVTRAGGGEVHAERVQFADLTGDGREEAVVVVESGGTAGDLGVAVYRLVEETPEVVFFRRVSGHVEVRVGVVVTQEGVYAAGEPRCCPSKLREVGYGWREGEFTLISDQVVDNPQR